MLKHLMLQKKIDMMRNEINEIEKREEEIKNVTEELEKDIEEAQTEEEIKVIEQKAEEIEGEKEELLNKKNNLEKEIKAIEAEIEELKAKQETIEKRGGNETMNKEINKENYLERQEVKEFYTRVKEAIMDKRALENGELLIPQYVIDRIQPLIADYSNLYNEVDKITLNGNARVIIEGARPEGIWVEMCDPVQELATSFEKVELDGFKVGGFIPVCNAILEDSLIDLAFYLERTLAEAIAKALDKAILLGEGATAKQPEGIIPNVPVTNETTASNIGEVLSAMGLIDTGDEEVGEIIAVMKRKTYYEKVLPQTIVPTADGRQVVQGVDRPNIAGLRVVFSNYAPSDTIILGDFKKYLLSERKGVTLSTSTHVKFVEDQTVFKGVARYDGKPVRPEAFAIVELVEAPEA